MVKDQKISWYKFKINYLRLTLVNALTNNEQYIFTAFFFLILVKIVMHY